MAKNKLKKREIRQFPKTLIVAPAQEHTRALTGVSEDDAFELLESYEEVVAKYALVEVCRVKRWIDFKPVKTYEPPLLGNIDRGIGPKALPHLPGPSHTKKLKKSDAA